MKLRAPVKSVTGTTKHFLGTVIDGKPVPVQLIPSPTWVEIVEKDGWFYLYRYDDNNVCLADSLFEDVEKAKSQATFEFDIAEEDWVEMP